MNINKIGTYRKVTKEQLLNWKKKIALGPYRYYRSDEYSPNYSVGSAITNWIA